MNYSSIFKSIVSIGFYSILFSCSHTREDVPPAPQVKAGVAKVYGKLHNLESKISSVTLSYENPITADKSIIEAKVNSDDSFYFEAPIECSTVFGVLNIGGYGGGLIELVCDEAIKVELEWDDDGEIKINQVSRNRLLTDQDKESYANALYKYSTYNNFDSKSLLKMTPDEYAHFELNIMEDRTNYAMKDAEFSKTGANIVSNELKLFHLKGALLSYVARMNIFVPHEEDSKNWSFQEPDIKYYGFLKSFDLNNPIYLYNIFYPETMQRVLSAKSLNIPLIGDTSVDKWLMDVKDILSPLIGFDAGQFYDVLAAHAYAKQFIEELRPLSDKQIKNINHYFKGKKREIAKILLRKNEEIIKFVSQREQLVVNETPAVSKEKLMDTIIAKYKGKVVVVDFWATWCGPCLDAMAKYKTIKGELKGKDVVFVYLTNRSSPQKLWEEKIKGIGGEHYYLNDEEWKQVMEIFGFEAIPSYVIFDAKGVVRHKFTGYPGNEEMLKMIKKLLP